MRRAQDSWLPALRAWLHRREQPPELPKSSHHSKAHVIVGTLCRRRTRGIRVLFAPRRAASWSRMETLNFMWDMFVLLLSSVTIVALVIALVQLIRTNRRNFVWLASASLAWLLLLWTSIADKYDVIRNGIGSFTLLIVRVVATAIFIFVTLQVLNAVWKLPKLPLPRWMRRAP